jgi:hypothetical protein
MIRRKQYNFCEICRVDISKRPRGTMACCPEHSIELVKRYQRKYFRDNRDVFNYRLRKWRKDNPEKAKQQRQRYYERKKLKKLL